MLLAENEEIIVKNNVKQHSPFSGPKLFALDCRQEKAKLEKNRAKCENRGILLQIYH